MRQLFLGATACLVGLAVAGPASADGRDRYKKDWDDLKKYDKRLREFEKKQYELAREQQKIYDEWQRASRKQQEKFDRDQQKLAEKVAREQARWQREVFRRGYPLLTAPPYFPQSTDPSPWPIAPPVSPTDLPGPHGYPDGIGPRPSPPALPGTELLAPPTPYPPRYVPRDDEDDD